MDKLWRGHDLNKVWSSSSHPRAAGQDGVLRPTVGRGNFLLIQDVAAESSTFLPYLPCFSQMYFGENFHHIPSLVLKLEMRPENNGLEGVVQRPSPSDW